MIQQTRIDLPHVQSPAVHLQKVFLFALRAVPGFLLTFADLLGIPSGLHAAYIAALSVLGLPIAAPITGSACALGMRALYPMGVPWDRAAALLILGLGAVVLYRRPGRIMTLWTALSLLPMALWRCLTRSLADGLLAVSSLVISMLAVPVMLRAIQVFREERPISGMEERVAASFLAAMLAAGGARMLVAGMNLGVLAVSAVVCCMSMYLGTGAGTITGLVAGLALALAGLPIEGGMCLACGGFLAGMIQPLGLRPVTCCACAVGCALTMLLSGADTLGALRASIAAPLVLALLPGHAEAQLRGLFRRFLCVRTPAGDAYAAAALGRWEHTMSAMAAAVPQPFSDEGPREGDWWRLHLCAVCPDAASCRAMSGDLAIHHAEEAWSRRDCPDDEWPQAMDALRGLGCGRLYCLRESMTAMRAEESGQRQQFLRAAHQRDMLVTHLTAMAGAAHRFAQLGGGVTWWDEMNARTLRRAVDERSFPASLLYLRRVDGHVHAALELHRTFDMRRLQEEARLLAETALRLPMEIERCEQDRLYLAQRAPWEVEYGCAGMGAQTGEASGDRTWLGRVGTDRFMAAVSDGMGQGERAGAESSSAVELLRLCLEAGYTRSQALTAVNGMLLLETGGERFATVDLLTVDLWTGQAALDKLGAVSSWLLRGETLLEVTGDALPIGVLETVSSRTSMLHLRPGDRLVLLTDGIEDAFDSREDLQRAIRRALTSDTPQAAAFSLLDRAETAGGRRDDMTAVVVELHATHTN